MLDTAIILRVAAVAMLMNYLYIKDRHRERSRPVSAEWIGNPMDLTELKPVLEDVRGDYLTSRSPIRSTFFNRSLLGLAQRTVERLTYFYDKDPEQHVQTDPS